jgi:predicted dehydrogenase
MTHEPVKTAVVGCGKISGIYLQNAQTLPILDVVACADLDMQRAEAQAAKFGVPRAMRVADVLADPEIELIINLTVPAAHATVGIAAIRTNKSVYNEKPLAINRDDGRLMLQEARERQVLVGCAPDTFLGGGLQTCRALIDDGAIGTPIAATAFILGHGPESWHPDPDFFYQVGGGPMFDMGPYYLTTLISMLGPVRRVTGSARITFHERMIGSEPKRGQTITVKTPTHIAGVLDFESGAIGTLVTSFDVWHAHVPRIEIYGTDGTLSLPDPNTFRGPVRLRRADDSDWHDMPLTHGYTENSRGIGAADMAEALRSGRPHRANGEMAYHVLDIMHAIHDASAEGRHIELTSTCSRPEPLPRSVAAQALIL